MLVITVVAARRLNPDPFAILAYAMATGWLLGVATDAGLSMYLARETAPAAPAARPSVPDRDHRPARRPGVSRRDDRAVLTPSLVPRNGGCSSCWWWRRSCAAR